MRVTLLAFVLACAVTFRTHARQVDVDSARIDSLRVVAADMKVMWEKMWRASDSLRIASVLVRMRADSINRTIKSMVLLAAKRRDTLATKPRATLTVNRPDTLATSRPDTSAASRLDTSAANRLATPTANRPVIPVVNAPAEAAFVSDQPEADSDSTTNAILETLALEAAARKAQVTLHTKKRRRGETLSDSITYHVLALDADTGMASYYANEFHGKRMSNGEVYNMNGLTCAHRWLPFGTVVIVTNLDNGKEVLVRVTDRGPFKETRIIDVSKGAAIVLGMVRNGTARVRIRLQQASADTTPADTIPADTTPAGTIPADTTPAGTIPAGTIPAGTIPAEP